MGGQACVIGDRRLRQARNQYQRLESELTDGMAGELRARVAAADVPACLGAACRLAFLHAGGEFREALAARRFLEHVARVPWRAQVPIRPRSEYEARLDAVTWGGAAARRKIADLAQRHARRPAACLYAPPGTGKTYLAGRFADALGLPFARVSLGGLRGDAVLRGTEAGAPGRLLEAVAEAGSFDAVVLLDDVDKVDDPEGGLWAALLDLLDAEGRRRYVDRYLAAPIDFSRTWFLLAAGDPAPLPAALRERAETVWLRGYDDAEKQRILSAQLWPAAAAEANLSGVDLAPAAARVLVAASAGEAGVRELRRAAERLARAWDGAGSGRTRIDGPAARKTVRRAPLRLPAERPGRVFGLAWTPCGGVIMPVETVLLPGGGGVRVTGRVGEIMGESVQAAYSWVRNHADRLGIDAETAARGMHVHFPEAATPKDGASAGLALVAGMISALRGRVMFPATAMTGEITVMGEVLPVGGVREKLLAALRGGLHGALIPLANRTDAADLSPADRRRLRIRYIASLYEWTAGAEMPGKAIARLDTDLIC